MDFNDLLSNERQEAFWANARKSSNGRCLIWLGGNNGLKQLRALYWHKGERYMASHVAYSLYHGRAVPEGMLVLHACDDPRCIEPTCLWLGSQRDNMIDCVSKKRHHHGGSHEKSKLDDIGVMLCRHAHVNGLMGISEMARKCGVNHSTMSMAVSGKQWKHLPMVKKSIERDTEASNG